jgi:hypothetical protein
VVGDALAVAEVAPKDSEPSLGRGPTKAGENKLFTVQSRLDGRNQHDDGATASNNKHGASSQDNSLLAACMARRAQLDEPQNKSAANNNTDSVDQVTIHLGCPPISDVQSSWITCPKHKTATTMMMVRMVVSWMNTKWSMVGNNAMMALVVAGRRIVNRILLRIVEAIIVTIIIVDMETTMLAATVVIMAVMVTILLGDNDNNAIPETTSNRLMVITVNGKQ